ncbi:MAG: hypothetical protein ACI835_004324 [Planctomycetota bacterium]|jgi:hypothetical protein
MNIQTIFGAQFVLSLVTFGLVTRWFVSPWLSSKSWHDATILLLLPHAIRHVGLGFLVQGLVDADAPSSFAGPAAYGDLTAGLLAIASMLAVRRGSSRAVPLLWVFSVVGVVHLLNALRQADAIPHLGGMWFIPTFLVPILLITHFMIIAQLRTHRS